MAKRLFDVVLSFAGLIVLAPLFVLIAVLIKLGSKGPVFFRQGRVGRHGEVFRIFKFRTMVADTERYGSVITAGLDPRVTWIGRFLRLTKIDELPQLINVLKGDMSLVGPRPELPQYVKLFLADYREILTARPGITDLASLKYRNEAAVLGQARRPEEYYVSTILPDKIRLAKEYLKHESILFDLGLILRTLVRIVPKDKAFFGVRLLPSVVLLAAVCVYPLVWSSAPRQAPDTRGYQAVAQDLIGGHFDHLQFRVPGFPLLLVLTGSADHLHASLFLAQLLLYVLSVYLLLKTLTALNVHSIVLLTTALVLVSPPFIEHTAYALSESLTASLLMVSFWLLITGANRFGLGVLSGLTFGAAALTRPTYQMLALAVAPVLVLLGQGRRALGLVCGAGLLIGSLCLFNYLNFGYFGTTPALGLNLSTRTARVVERLPPSPLRDALIKARDAQLMTGASHTGVMYIWSIESELPAITGMRDLSLERFMLRLNLRLIMAAPLEYLTDVGHAAVNYWFPAFTEISFGYSRQLQLVWTLLSFAVAGLFWVLLLALCGTSITHGLKSARSEPIVFMYVLAVVVVLYTMAVSCLLEVGNPRYRVPTDSMVVFATALGLKIWLQEWADARSGARSSTLREPLHAMGRVGGRWSEPAALKENS